MEDVKGLGEATAKAIRKLRNKAGLTQQELADFACLSRGHIAEIEGLRSNVTLNALHRIAEALSMTTPDLITEIYKEFRP